MHAVTHTATAPCIHIGGGMATAGGDALGATGQVIRRRSDDALTGKGGAADE